MVRWILLGLLAAPLAAEAKAVRAFVGKYSYRDPGAVMFAPTVEAGRIRAETHGPSPVIAHGPQLGVSLLGLTAGNLDLQGQASIGYRTMNIEGLEIDERPRLQLVESQIGLRYFPRAPTLLLAERACVRVTAAASAGVAVSLNGDLNYPVDVAAGLHLTAGRVPHGLALELVHRPNHFDLKYRPRSEPGDPVAPEKKYDVSPWTGLRVSFWFGP
jgi:hypothetical protein